METHDADTAGWLDWFDGGYDEQHDNDEPDAPEGAGTPDSPREDEGRESRIDPELKKLLDSTNEREKFAGDTLKSLLSSENPAERRDGERLLAMLKEPATRTEALVLLADVYDSDARRQILDLLSDDKNEEAAKVITEMLRSGADSGVSAVATLMTLLGSENAGDIKMGEQLLAMLNNPQEQSTARVILERTNTFTGDLRTIMTLLKDPAQKERTDQILTLLKSSSELEQAAGSRLLAMIGSGDRQAKQDADTLLSMMKKPDLRSIALDIAGKLSDATHVHQLLDIVRNPEMAKVSAALLKRLHSDGGEVDVANVLGLLGSNDAKEKAMGDKMLNLLAKGTDEQLDAALRVLRFTSSIEYRNELLKALEDPATRAGVDRLMDWCRAPRRRERETAGDLLDMMGSLRGKEADTARELLKLLSGPPEQQKMAKLIMSTIPDNASRAEMVRLLNSEKHADAARKMISILEEGSRKTAVTALLDMLAREPGSKAAEQLLKMMADPAKCDDACAILRNANGPSHVSKLMELLADPKTKDGASELLKMLKSDNYQSRSAANRVLELMGASNFSGDLREQILIGRDAGMVDQAKADGERLLSMLGKPDQRDLAMHLLSRIESPAALTRLLDMLGNGDQRELAQKLVKLSERDSFAVQQMLKQLTPEGMKKCMEVFEKGGTIARHVRYMMETNSPGFRHLFAMLTSPDESTVKAGEKALAALGTSLEFYTQSVLDARLNPQDTQKMLELLKDRKHWSGAQQLLNLLQPRDRQDIDDVPPPPVGTGAQDVLRMLSSSDAATRAVGEKYLEMLADPAKRGTATAVLEALSGEAEVTRMLAALQNEKEKSGAEELAKLLASQDAGIRSSARTVVRLLTSGDATQRAHGQRLLDMLSDRQKKDTAVNLIRSVRDIAGLMRLTDASPSAPPAQRETARVLQEMIGSGDPRALRRADTLVTLLRSGDEATVKALTAMITDRAREADLTAVLSLEDASLSETLLKVLADPKSAEAGKSLLEMIKSDDAAKRDGAKALLRLRREGRDGSISRPGGREEKSPFDQMVERLNKPETRDAAQKALSLCTEPNHVEKVNRLLDRPDGEESLDKLVEMSKDPAKARYASRILERLEPGQIKTVLDMLKDPKQADLARTLLDNLDDMGGLSSTAATALIIMLSSEQPEMKATGELLTEMMRNESEKDLAELLAARLGFTRSLSPGFLQMLRGESNRVAAEFVAELLKSEDVSDRQAVATLASMLVSDDPALKREGQRLMRLMNDESHKYGALRLLKQRAPQRRNPFLDLN